MGHTRPHSGRLTDPLTEREQEILACLADGLTNQEIANRLHLAEKTVRRYNSQIYSKLGVKTRREAVAQAATFGLVQAESSPKPVRHNLPAPTTPFVGREQELAELTRLLADEQTRLITILAPGGMGKTRLALEAAKQQLANFPDGVYFVPLAPLESVDSIVPTVAAAMGMRLTPGSEPRQQLLRYLRSRKLLLILDNFEHLLNGARLVSDILQAAGSVQVLVSSRERLSLSGEVVFVVGGMEVPEPEVTQDALNYSGIQLFLEHARRFRLDQVVNREDLGQIGRICRLTDGMPLAIILASAWVAVLSPAEIAEQIIRNLDFLQGKVRDLPERLHSVRAVFEATWHGLSPDERTAFKRLSVFRGGCSREAAVQVVEVTLPTLQSLINKALLSRNGNGRYEIHELLRQYGEEQLAQTPDEYDRVRDRHCSYYASYAQQMYDDLYHPDPKSWLAAMESDLENHFAGWEWACLSVQRGALSQFIPSFDQFHYLRCRYEEGVRVFGQAVAALETNLSDGQPDVLLAHLLADHANFCSYADETRKHQISYRKSLDILRRLDDLGSRQEAVRCLWLLASCLRFIRPGEARDLFEECIAYCRDYNHPKLLVKALGNRFTFVSIKPQDIPVIEEMLILAHQLGMLRYTAMALQYRGLVAHRFEDNPVLAKSLLEEGINLLQRADDPFNLAIVRFVFASVALDAGDLGRARGAFLEALRFYDTFGGLLRITPPTLLGSARLLATVGNQEGATALCAFVQYSALRKDQEMRTVSYVNVDPATVLDALEAELPPAVFAAAVERGQSLDMESSIKLALRLLEETDVPAVNEFQVANQALATPLTPREFEVLQLILAGLSNSAIAETLVISKNTLKTHISRLYGKLEVDNRAQAVLRGRELGLLK